MKLSINLRNNKRKTLFVKYLLRTKFFSKLINKISFLDNLKCKLQCQKLKRDCFPSRYRKRCQFTGRGRGLCGFFGASRHVLKELASQNIISGLRKSSW
jgi:small subunit ribosomal protein S14